MNNEPEVVMSSSPISKCQQSKTQSSTSSSTKKLTLVVDKTRFICNALIFNQHPNTLLGKMFSPHLLNRQGKFILFIPGRDSMILTFHLISSVKPFKSKSRDKIYLDASNPNLKKRF